MRKKIQRISIMIGVLLIAINSIGLFHYTTIDEHNPKARAKEIAQISESEFWSELRDTKVNINSKDGVIRLNTLVSNRMLHIDHKYTSPTFFENYLLWAYSRYTRYYEWVNTKRAIRLGGGFCSQQAIVLDNLLKTQGIESTIIGLSGHVVNEVLVDEGWMILDPDYNVSIGFSLRELEHNHDIAHKAYKQTGLSDGAARRIAQMYTSHQDNWRYKGSVDFKGYDYYIERMSR